MERQLRVAAGRAVSLRAAGSRTRGRLRRTPRLVRPRPRSAAPGWVCLASRRWVARHAASRAGARWHRTHGLFRARRRRTHDRFSGYDAQHALQLNSLTRIGDVSPGHPWRLPPCSSAGRPPTCSPRGLTEACAERRYRPVVRCVGARVWPGRPVPPRPAPRAAPWTGDGVRPSRRRNARSSGPSFCRSVTAVG